MSLLRQHLLDKRNARTVALRVFHEMREVMASDLLPSEKGHLISRAHDTSIANRMFLVRPSKPTLSGPYDARGDGRRTSHSEEERVAAYVKELGDMLGFRAAMQEYSAVVEEMSAILVDGSTDAEKFSSLKVMIPRLKSALENTGLLSSLDPDWIHSGYCKLSALTAYVQSFENDLKKNSA